MSKKPKPKSTGRINLRDLDSDLHAQFKARCAARGRSMKGLVVAFMQDVVSSGRQIVNVGELSRAYKNPK